MKKKKYYKILTIMITTFMLISFTFPTATVFGLDEQGGASLQKNATKVGTADTNVKEASESVLPEDEEKNSEVSGVQNKKAEDKNDVLNKNGMLKSPVKSPAKENSSEKKKVDDAVKILNENGIFRIAGLNKLDKNASASELDKFYNEAVKLAGQRVKASENNIVVKMHKKGRFRAQYFDGTDWQSACIANNIFEVSTKDGSYKQITEACIFFDVKTDVKLKKVSSVLGTDTTKEKATYQVSIDDPGYVADSYTSTLVVKEDGELVWNGYVATMYKLNSKGFCKLLYDKALNAVLSKKYNVEIDGDKLNIEAKETGFKNLSIEFYNKPIDLKKVETETDKKAKVDKAYEILDKKHFRYRGLNQIKEDASDAELKVVREKVLEDAKKAVKAEENGLLVTLDDNNKGNFRPSNELEAASILQLGLIIGAEKSDYKKLVKVPVFPERSTVWLEKVDSKSHVGDDGSVEVLTHKVKMEGLGTDSYTTYVNLYEGNNCVYSGAAAQGYKMNSKKFAQQIVAGLKGSKVGYMTKYYDFSVDGDEFSIKSKINGKLNLRLEFINDDYDYIPNTEDAIGAAKKEFWKIEKYFKYRNEPSVKAAIDNAVEDLLNQRTIEDVEKSKIRGIAAIEEAIKPYVLAGATERTLESPKSKVEKSSGIYISAKGIFGEKAKLAVNAASQDKIALLEKELAKYNGNSLGIFQPKIEGLSSGEIELTFDLGKDRSNKDLAISYFEGNQIITLKNIKSDDQGLVKIKVKELTPIMIASRNAKPVTKEEKEKVDAAVKSLNEYGIFRVSGLNDLEQNATEEQLNDIYTRLIKEVEKSLAEKNLTGLNIEIAHKGTFRAQYDDIIVWQAADIHGVKFYISPKGNDSYTVKTDSCIVFDTKNEIKLEKQSSTIGTPETKEKISYRVKIGSPGYAKDRYTSTLKVRLGGKVLWNGYIPTEYKEDGAKFGKRIAEKLAKSDLRKYFDVERDGDIITFTAKENGVKNLSVEFYNEPVDLEEPNYGVDDNKPEEKPSVEFYGKENKNYNVKINNGILYYIIGKSKGASLRVLNLHLKDLDKVVIQGSGMKKILTGGVDYESKEGSIIINLKKGFLDSLSEGRYKVAIVSKNQEVFEKTIEVKKAKVLPNDKDKNGNGKVAAGNKNKHKNKNKAVKQISNSVATGDNSPLVYYIIILVLASIGATLIIRNRRHHRNR